MAGFVLGPDLPNLKIAVDNVGNDSEPEVVEEEMPEEGEDSSASEKEPKPEVKITFNSCPFPENQGPRLYENKAGAFAAGIDFTSEEAQKKFQERASRFGIEVIQQSTITSKDINALHKSCGIKDNLEDDAKSLGLRLNCIHIRGVNDMSTEDVFSYFKDYVPSTIEWINDYSCNVVWLENLGAARAMIGMSESVVHFTSRTEKMDSKINEEAASASEGEISHDESDAEAEKETKMEETIVSEKSPKTKEDVEENEESNQSGKQPEMTVPVPPGTWRIGLPDPKAKMLFFRFATKDDKKIAGAEKRSEYYFKYGNPNYGGLKGLISKSRKRKHWQNQLSDDTKEYEKSYQEERRSKQHDERRDSDKGSHSSTNSTKSEEEEKSDESDTPLSKLPKTKLTMKMYADKEEEKRRKKPTGYLTITSRSQSTLKGRLGKTREEFTESSSEEEYSEEEEQEDDRPRKKASVWERLSVSSKRRKDALLFDLRNRIPKDEDEDHFDEDDDDDVDDRPRSDLRQKLKLKSQIGRHRSPLCIEVDNS